MSEPGPRYESVTVEGKSFRVYELYWSELRECIRAAVKVRAMATETSVEFDPVTYVDSLLRRAVRDASGNGIDVDRLTRKELDELVYKVYELNPFPGAVIGG